MTREDIDNIISIICPNDEDFEKPIISPAYLKKELETLALEQEPSGDAISRQADNLCSSCTNIGCEFQSGIVRTKCVFYMPPHIEPDNCGNYVVMQPTTEELCIKQEPKTGHWIEHTGWNDDNYNTEYSCSNCNEWVKEKTNFCPNCGARMWEEKANESRRQVHY